MPNIWNIRLTNQRNATYTCALMDVEDAIALKRLEIKWDPSGSLVAIVEPKPEGVYIKEVAVQGERLGFRKENGMLLPADRKTGDTWQVSTQKKSRLATILFKMDLTVVASEQQRLVLSVDMDVNVRALFKKRNETVAATVSVNPHEHFKLERVQLPNGDIYENRD